MNCIEFETALELAIETRTPLGSSSLEHAAACAECRLALDINRQLGFVIEAWRPVQPSSRLIGAVLEELATPTARRSPLVTVAEDRRSRPPSNRFAVASVVACLLMVILFGTQKFGGNSVELAKATGPNRSRLAAASKPLDVTQTLTEVFSDLRSEYRGMASETTSAAREFANAIPRQVTVPILPISNELETIPSSSTVVKIWSPIGSRVESALGFLWQAVPGEVPAG